MRNATNWRFCTKAKRSRVIKKTSRFHCVWHAYFNAETEKPFSVAKRFRRSKNRQSCYGAQKKSGRKCWHVDHKVGRAPQCWPRLLPHVLAAFGFCDVLKFAPGQPTSSNIGGRVTLYDLASCTRDKSRSDIKKNPGVVYLLLLSHLFSTFWTF